MAEYKAQQYPKITVHWLEQSRAQRILWLLEEVNVPYELKVYKRRKDVPLAPKELQKIHPLGKSPVITIESKSGKTRVIGESALIIEYLSDHFGKHLVPERYPSGDDAQPGAGEETEEWLKYRYLMHYSEGSLFPQLLIGLFLYQLKGPSVPFLIRPITRIMANIGQKRFWNAEITKHWIMLEDLLNNSEGDYFCGAKLTGADFIMSYPLQAALEAKFLNSEKYPKLTAWVAKFESLDEYKRAVKVVEEKTSEKFSLAPGMY